MALLVSLKELQREKEELRRLREEYNAKWKRLRAIVYRVRHWERRIADLEDLLAALKAGLPGTWRAYVNVRDIRLPNARGRLFYWGEEREAKIREIIEEREVIRAAEAQIKLKVLEEWIGDEACSGYDIYYGMEYSEAEGREVGVYQIRDPDTHELIRTDDKLAVAMSASISTDVGHDVPITLEIMAVTFVREMNLTDLTRLDTAMERATMDWLKEQGWGALLHAFEKIGVEYNGETHVKAVKLYPFTVPDYPTIHFIVERRSRYVKERTYEGEKEVA